MSYILYVTIEPNQTEARHYESFEGALAKMRGSNGIHFEITRLDGVSLVVKGETSISDTQKREAVLDLLVADAQANDMGYES